MNRGVFTSNRGVITSLRIEVYSKRGVLTSTRESEKKEERYRRELS